MKTFCLHVYSCPLSQPAPSRHQLIEEKKLDPLALANQVLSKIQSNQHEDAAVDLQILIDNNAMLGDKWGALARLAITIGERKLAVSCAVRYFNVKPGWERISQVAGIYAEAGQLQEAIDFIKPRIGNKLDFTLAHLLGTLYGQLGQLEMSADYLTKAIKLNPTSGVTWLTLTAQTNLEAFPELFEKLKSLCEKADEQNWQNDARLYFALAKAYADAGQKAQSYDYYKKANDLFAAHVPNRTMAPMIDNIIKSTGKAQIQALPAPRMITDRPIFIMGLPRSGTTLLEQIISSHSEIVGGGELNAFGLANSAFGDMTIPKVLDSFDREGQVDYFDKVVNRYLHLWEEQLGYNGRFVDKTLNNNRQLGLIANIFPSAPLIMIRRKPEDIAWSCYRACFNDGSFWTWSPERIAHYIRSEERLFDHWLETIPSRILVVQYEDLLLNFDEEVTRLMNYLNLPFEPQQREFYKQQNSVTTSSMAQVRSPIDPTAAERSKDANAFVEEFLTHYNKA